MTAQAGPMSNLQLELLKLYSTSISEQQLLDIRRILAAYFAEMIDCEMAILWEEKGWGDDTLESWKSERMRTSHPSA